MKLFTVNRRYSKVESAISAFVLVGLIATTLIPQTTNATTNVVMTTTMAPIVQVKTAYQVKHAYDGVNFPESSAREARYVLYVVATAYSSEVAQTDDTPCIPAMWKFDLCEYYDIYGVADTIAANDLPLGTKVRFPDVYGDKVFTVRDRMNRRYTGKSRIDLWKPERSEAIQFGVQRMKMEVL
jgi:3D (Asp-Asp-Asp) domain-containing protein